MESHNYQRDEKVFLEDTATRFGFKDKYRFVFVQRFLSDNDDLKNEEFADLFQKNLQRQQDTFQENLQRQQDAVPLHILRDKLKEIFPRLEKAGCPFNGVTRDKCDIAKSWLRETLYPQWHFWRQLKGNGEETDRMGPVLLSSKVSKLELFPEETFYPKSLRLGSHIGFEVDLETEGYLLLLERATSGKFYCLCPSILSPAFSFPAGKEIFPKRSLRDQYFKLSGLTGVEEMVAVICQELPPLDWLPKLDGKPLLFKESHLQTLVNYVEQQNCRVLYMDYVVTV